MIQYCVYSLYCALALQDIFTTHCKFVPLNSIPPTLPPSSPRKHHFTRCFYELCSFRFRMKLITVFAFVWVISVSIALSKLIHVVTNGRISFLMAEQYSRERERVRVCVCVCVHRLFWVLISFSLILWHVFFYPLALKPFAWICYLGLCPPPPCTESPEGHVSYAHFLTLHRTAQWLLPIWLFQKYF